MSSRFIFIITLIMLTACVAPKKDALAPNMEEVEPNNSKELAQNVSHGTIVKGFINEKMDQDWYQITIPDDSSAILRAELTGINNINLKLELFDVDGGLLLEVDRHKEGMGEILTNYLLNPGSSYLRVRELWLKNQDKKFSDTLAYNLRVYLTKVTGGIEIEPNNKSIRANFLEPDSAISGYLSPYGDVDWYQLSLMNQNERYLRISLSALENVDTKIKIYDPIEAIIDEANEGGKGVAEKIVNLGVDPLKEYYYIVVEGGNWQTNEVNPYQLCASFIPIWKKMEFEPNDRLIKATEIADGDTISGFIDHPKDVDWYRIKDNMFEAQIARIDVMGVPGVDLCLKLLNEAEQQILYVNETGEQENERIANIGLEVSEHYFIKIESITRGANSTDQYAICLSMSPCFSSEEYEMNNSREKANSIELERAIAGYIHPVGDVDYYRLVLQNRIPGNLEIILEGIMKVNTDMALYNEQMREIGRAAAAPAEETERLIFDPKPGIYYLKVYDNDGKESNYRDKYKLAIFLKS